MKFRTSMQTCACEKKESEYSLPPNADFHPSQKKSSSRSDA